MIFKGKHYSLLFCIMLIYSINISYSSYANYTGRTCVVESGITEDGRWVSGEFYMYSDRYGESDGVYTDDFEFVYGECYRFSGRYCEFDGVYTEGGQSVTGECYIE